MQKINFKIFYDKLSIDKCLLRIPWSLHTFLGWFVLSAYEFAVGLVNILLNCTLLSFFFCCSRYLNAISLHYNFVAEQVNDTVLNGGSFETKRILRELIIFHNAAKE